MSFVALERESLWVGLGAAVVAEALCLGMARAGARGGDEGGPMARRVPRPALAIALVVGGLLIGLRGAGTETVIRKLVAMTSGGTLMLLAGLASDMGRPRSERHLAALAVATGIATVAGIVIPFSDFFGLGPFVFFGPAVSVLLTAAWVFLVVSIIELTSLLPLLAGVTAVVLAGAGWAFRPDLKDAASAALPPLILGAVVGRTIAGMVLGGGRFLEKSETLVLGFFVAAMTVTSFTKTFVMAGVILPTGLLSIIAVVLLLRAFERSLLLRPTPRS